MSSSSPLRYAGTVATAMLAAALVAWCAANSTKYRRMTGIDRCMAMPAYQGPAGPLVGYLIGGAIVDPGTGPVKAIDVTVVVDGGVRSVWRRQSEVMQWYVPVGAISSHECHWTSPNLLPAGQWQPTDVEFGLDVRLWHILLGGWSTHHGLFTIGEPI